MSMAVQGSLLDEGVPVRFRPLAGQLERVHLGLGAWLDVLPGWLAGSEQVFDQTYAAVPWHAERRRMYDAVVDVPRLTKFYGTGEPLPVPALATAKQRLSDHYVTEIGEPLTSAGLCLYRDGRDSVAWHGDTIGRGATHDTVVAILSLGAPRVLALRARGGGRTAYRQAVGHGDLLVMGGSCQRTWEHAVPKTTKPVGPRISVQFRPAGIR